MPEAGCMEISFNQGKEKTMKVQSFVSSALFASILAAGVPALADEAHHPDQKAGAAAPAADQAIQKMQANTKKMQAQLEKMAKSKDPKERQQLMQEHMKTMRENMAMGQGMMGMDCPMMSGGMGQGMGMGMGMMGQGGGGMGPEAMMQRMQMMEKRMDMMQMMMEQMSKGQAGAK